MIDTAVTIAVTEIEPRTYHLVFDNQRDLAQTLMRLQEYYEGPNDSIRGHYFTLEEFLHQYTDAQGRFGYTTDWGGFNVPGHVVEAWRTLFSERDGLTHKERQMMQVLDEARAGSSDPWYMIATGQGDLRTIRHELAHARYYLNHSYREGCDALLAELHPRDRRHMGRRLIRMGYTPAVESDEIQAYLSTSTAKELGKWFDEFHESSLPVLRRFRKHFKDTNRGG